jgi:hypothetical protein
LFQREVAIWVRRWGVPEKWDALARRWVVEFIVQRKMGRFVFLFSMKGTERGAAGGFR